MTHSLTKNLTANTNDHLVELHEQRSMDDLRERMRSALDHVVPEASTAILLARDEATWRSVELTRGPELSFAEGASLQSEPDEAAGARRFPLRYHESELGELLLVGEAEDEALAHLGQLIDNYVVALVNLTLNADALNSSALYYASLQAFEEGVVLFQEPSREAVSARFLSLVTSVLNTNPGALFLLEEPGNPSSALRLDTVLGVPEPMLDELALPDGTWWPPTTVEDGPKILERDSDGILPELDNDRVPSALTSVVTCPLRFHGLIVGVSLAFNCDCQDPGFPAKLESLRSLGALGAAIFQRLKLEAVALRSQEVETQLTIAAQIQSGLVPKEAPSTPHLECAWQSRAAQKIGGDYVDLLEDENGDLCAVIADVSGHGLNSALLMISFRATYRGECFRRTPAKLLEKLNCEIVNEAGDTGMFVTAATLRFGQDGRHVTYASAGHNDIYIYRAADKSIDVLESTGPSTGFFPGSDYDELDVVLNQDDVMLLYTDGLVEALAPSSETDMFGDDRLIGLLKEHAERRPQEILELIQADLEVFTEGEAYEDDVSITVIKGR